MNITTKSWWVKNAFIILLLLWLAANHWLNDKYEWIKILLGVVWVAAFIGELNRKKSTVTTPPDPRVALYSVGFVVAFLALAIFFNPHSWFLAALIPFFVVFLCSFVLLLRKKRQSHVDTSLSSNTV